MPQGIRRTHKFQFTAKENKFSSDYNWRALNILEPQILFIKDSDSLRGNVLKV